MGQKPAETATALVVAVADIGSLAGTTRSQTVRRTLQIWERTNREVVLSAIR